MNVVARIITVALAWLGAGSLALADCGPMAPCGGGSATIPVPVAQGGTAATTSATALANLGAAAADGSTPFTAAGNGATGAASAAQRAGEVIDARADFGMYCDGQHHYLSNVNSYAGVNTTGFTVAQWQNLFPTLPTGANLTQTDLDGLALSDAYAAGVASGKAFKLVVNCPRGYATWSVNLSGLSRKGVVADFTGSQIVSSAYAATSANAPIIDFSGDQFLTINSPYTSGSNYSGGACAANEPYSGMRFARLTAGVEVGNITLINPKTDGCFTHAGLENVATEVSGMYGPNIINQDVSGTGYGLVEDNANHFNAAASEAVLANGQPYQTISLTQDVSNSMTQDIVYGGQFACTCISPAWLSGMQGGKFIGTYFNNSQNLTSNYGMTLYETAANSEVNLTVDAYFEGTNLSSVFFVTGSTATPVVSSLKYSTRSDWSHVSTFATDTGIVTSAKLTNADITIPVYSNGTTPTLFKNASLWSLSGSVRVPVAANWTAPASASGTICAPTCTPLVPTTPINRNPDFVIDQKYETGGAVHAVNNGDMVVDGWDEQNAGVAVTAINFQRLPTVPLSTAIPYYLRTGVAVTASPTAAQFYVITTDIEGSDAAVLQWGSAAANPATLDYCIYSSVAPVTIPVYITNGSNNRTFVIDNSYPTASVWKCYTNAVPGDTTGTWAKIANNLGIKIGVGLGVGSNFLATNSGEWEAGQHFGTSASSQVVSQANGTIVNITAVHFYPTQFDMPYAPRSLTAELAIDQHWYRKSFRQGVAVGQNTSDHAVGAASILAPFAFATATLFGTQIGPFAPLYNNGGTTPPIVTFYSTGAATANCYNSTRAQDSGAAAAVNVGDNGFLAECSLVTGDAADNLLQVQYDAWSGF